MIPLKHLFPEYTIIHFQRSLQKQKPTQIKNKINFQIILQSYNLLFNLFTSYCIGELQD